MLDSLSEAPFLSIISTKLLSVAPVLSIFSTKLLPH